jgi:hypothetical protein
MTMARSGKKWPESAIGFLIDKFGCPASLSQVAPPSCTMNASAHSRDRIAGMFCIRFLFPIMQI